MRFHFGLHLNIEYLKVILSSSWYLSYNFTKKIMVKLYEALATLGVKKGRSSPIARTSVESHIHFHFLDPSHTSKEN